jgi:hypothetical protein
LTPRATQSFWLRVINLGSSEKRFYCELIRKTGQRQAGVGDGSIRSGEAVNGRQDPAGVTWKTAPSRLASPLDAVPQKNSR